MTSKMHASAGAIALLTITCFWFSTLFAEVFGNEAQIRLVKEVIPYGFILLIPALALTGLSGTVLSKGRSGRLINIKQKRMPIIALNGLIVLVPAALFLSAKASAEQFDLIFYAVQGAELLFGGINITLLALNMRDGLKMTHARRRAKA